MSGYNVMHPIGWDAFGLPAENAAIDRQVHPAKWTYENIETMKNQLKKLGISYDWDRELFTCREDYYKWGQWFFLKMYEKGLVEKKKSGVNWCNTCNTVLANEQVEDGKCWRCSDTVEIKDLEQWFFKITKYSEELLTGHDELIGNWPERVLTMQKNWIGKSYGMEANFKLDGEDFPIFTTRPDTVYGVTFMAIAAEHPIVDKIIKETADKKLAEDLKAFVNKVKHEDKISRTADNTEKEGIFTGKYVHNPFSGEDVPLYIANFVLTDYGFGAIMSVPAHDQRDFMFAKKYNIPIRPVIKPVDADIDSYTMESAYTGSGVMINSGEYNGLSSDEAKEKIADLAASKGIGKKAVNYKLKDWLLSRQRYWGNPIPVIYCEKCGTVPVPEKELPVKLPEDVEFIVGKNPLETSASFLNVACPKCGKPSRRETDTMDTFVDSSWYFLRFCSPWDDKSAVDKSEADYWMNVDQYIGGIEHAVMHLLYARFFHKVMRDLGLLKTDEPFKKLLTQGMVVSYSYKDPKGGYISYDELDALKAKDADIESKLEVKLDKMSKSKKNGVDPDKIIAEYGSDSVRLFILFAAPPDRDLEWNDDALEGSFRFVKRVHTAFANNFDKIKDLKTDNIENLKIDGENKKFRSILHKTIKQVSEDFKERHSFNTGIARIMELVNAIYHFKPYDDTSYVVLRESFEVMAKLLNPVTPHISEEMHSLLGFKEYVTNSSWPEYIDALTRDDEIELVIQINGKVRSKLGVASDISKEEAEKLSLEDEKVKTWLEGKNVVKVIYVPKKLVNIVVK
jgi:leucyl-tRNA synthetase